MPNSTLLVHLIQEMRNPANYLTIIQMYHLFNTLSPANQMQKKMQSCQCNLCLLKPCWSLVSNDGKVFTNQCLTVFPQIFLKTTIKTSHLYIEQTSFPQVEKLPCLSPCHRLLFLTFH